jgi:hypothetical protein
MPSFIPLVSAARNPIYAFNSAAASGTAVASALVVTASTAGVFLPASFLATGLFTCKVADFLAATFVRAETTFCAAAFLLLTALFAAEASWVPTFSVTAFFGPAFLIADFLSTTFGSLVVGGAVETAAGASIKNFERSLAPEIHAGARPRPLHVAPVLGSRYCSGCKPFSWPLCSSFDNL